MKEILVFVISYLLGSISFSYLITKKLKKIDIRQHGSGNAGATNTLRVLGVGPAIFVLLLDVAKGVVSVILAELLGLEPWAIALAGLFAIIGHNWPVFYRFRGGKGVATTIGVFFTLIPISAVFAGVVAILVIALTRYVSLGSLIFILLTPIFNFFVGHNPIEFSYFGFIIVILSFIRHRTNILRLIKGEENKIGQKTKVM